MLRRWDKSRFPRGAFSLNRDCPQAGGLVAWYPWGGQSGRAFLMDQAGRYHMTASAPPRMGPSGRHGEPVAYYDDAGSQYFEHGVALITATPLTLAAWFISDDDTRTDELINVSRTDANHRFHLQHRGSIAGDFLGAAAADGVTAALATSASAVAANVLYHGCGVFASDSSRTAYLNGVPGTTETTAVTPSGLNRTNIGAVWFGGAAVNFFSGMIGESGIWNVALSQLNISRLNDPGLRFELWYPLRSPKWISFPAGVITGVGHRIIGGGWGGRVIGA